MELDNFFGTIDKSNIEIRTHDCSQPKPGVMEIDLGDGEVMTVAYDDRIDHFDGRIELVNCRIVE